MDGKWIVWTMTAALCSQVPLSVVSRAEAVVSVVAVGGDPAPDGNGKFFDLLLPSINRTGQVAFLANFTMTTGGNTDNAAICRGTDAAGSLSVVVRASAPSPDG